MTDSKIKKKECPSCATMIDAKENVCPICRYEFPKSSLAFKIIASILIIVVIIYFVKL